MTRDFRIWIAGAVPLAGIGFVCGMAFAIWMTQRAITSTDAQKSKAWSEWHRCVNAYEIAKAGPCPLPKPTDK